MTVTLDRVQRQVNTLLDLNGTNTRIDATPPYRTMPLAT
jgi:hypothetical protein